MIYWHVTKDQTGKVWYGGDPSTDTPDLSVDLSDERVSWTSANGQQSLPRPLRKAIRDDLLTTYDASSPPKVKGMRVLGDFLAGLIERHLPDDYQTSDDTTI